MRTLICISIATVVMAVGAAPAISAVSTSCSGQHMLCRSLCHAQYHHPAVCMQKCDRQEIRCEVQAPAKGNVAVSNGTAAGKSGSKTPIGLGGLTKGIGSKDGQPVFVRGGKGPTRSGDGIGIGPGLECRGTVEQCMGGKKH